MLISRRMRLARSARGVPSLGCVARAPLRRERGEFLRLANPGPHRSEGLPSGLRSSVDQISRQIVGLSTTQAVINFLCQIGLTSPSEIRLFFSGESLKDLRQRFGYGQVTSRSGRGRWRRVLAARAQRASLEQTASKAVSTESANTATARCVDRGDGVGTG